ncbi:Sensor histidine kinase LiaS [Streptomyces sp. RB5]|uniref:histidine kinase n=1 Tax=Streptomyces smaragdinus TaxID=2585196 RepID=A0A7K0CF94_9ACTN|nr:sensor histidine kinase [Streptomyces smaragdinus]MQY11712.1 Sensor histidine kinase LiaS [Streptomyces smaragdinus]
MRSPSPPRPADEYGTGSLPWPAVRWLQGPAGRIPWPSTLLLAVITAVGTWGASANQHGIREPAGWLTYVLALGAVALLLLRYRRPRLVVAGTSAAMLLYLALGYAYGPVFASVAVAAFAAVSVGERRVVWWTLGVLMGGHLLMGHWLYRWLPPAGDGPANWGQALFAAAWITAVVAGGELARTRREQWARAAAELRETRRRRADEERLRIARELHDVLAHSISVINVQAGVGLALLDQHPDKAREALTTIKDASKEALGEVRQVLDALRASGGTAPRAPAPGLDRLGELTEHFAGAGLTVAVRAEGDVRPLPPATDLAAFRIVQEALTNVVRHSASRSARVVVGREPGELRLQIDDDGPAAPGGTSGGGNGLVGMRERAAGLGGRVEAGPREDGGFRVRAVIPLGRAATVAPGTAEEEAP